MTAEARRNNRSYGYDGNAARQPQHWEESGTRRQTRRRKRQARHHGLQVREPGKVAPVAVLGFLLACLTLMLTLGQYGKLVAVNDAAVDLRKELETLKTDEAKLLAQYEMAYDLQTIEQELLGTGQMIKAQNGQSDTIALSRPDSVQYYEHQGFAGSMLTGLREIATTIQGYF